MTRRPAGPVSGFYLSRTGSTRFKVGKTRADQVENMMWRLSVVKEEANLPAV